jgi:hypothetical protein
MAEKLTPQEIAEKQAQRLSAATADIQRGVERVTEAPGVRAAQRADKMRARIIESIDSGKWARNVGGVSLQEWKDATIQKGISRIGPGVTAARPKIARFHEQRQSHQASIDSELERMPDTTLQDGINRAIHQMQRMAEFSFDKSR